MKFKWCLLAFLMVTALIDAVGQRTSQNRPSYNIECLDTVLTLKPTVNGNIIYRSGIMVTDQFGTETFLEKPVQMRSVNDYVYLSDVTGEFIAFAVRYSNPRMTLDELYAFVIQCNGSGGSGGAGVTDGDYVDIIVTGDGANWNIDNGAVAYNDLSQEAKDSIAASGVTIPDGDYVDIVVSGSGSTLSIDSFAVDYEDLSQAVRDSISASGAAQEITFSNEPPIDSRLVNEPTVLFDTIGGAGYLWLEKDNQWKKISNESPEEIDLIILLGQSNADGTAENTGQPAVLIGDTDSLYIYSTNDYGFVQAGQFTNEGFFNYGTEHGIELGLKATYPDSLGKRRLYIIKYAYHGEEISDFMQGGIRWPHMIQYIEGGINRLLLQNKIPRVHIVWMQGEADALTSEDRNAYSERLDTFFNQQLRPIIGNAPVIIPQIQRANALDDTIKIETAQWVNSDALADTIETLGFGTIDFDHWDTLGLKQIGRALIPKMRELPALRITRPVGSGLPIGDSVFYNVESYPLGDVPDKFFTTYNGNPTVVSEAGEKWIQIVDSVTNFAASISPMANFARIDTVSYGTQNIEVIFKARKISVAGSKVGLWLRGAEVESNMLRGPGIQVEFEFTRSKINYSSGYTIQAGTTANYPVELGNWNANSNRWFKVNLRDSILTVDVSADGTTWYNNRVDTIGPFVNSTNWATARFFGTAYLVTDIDNNGNDVGLFNNISVKPLARPSEYLITNNSLITDLDNDTRIDVESNVDEDKIRFFVRGKEVFYIDQSLLNLKESLGIDSNLFTNSDTLNSPIDHEISGSSSLNFKQTGNVPFEDLFSISDDGISIGNTTPETNGFDVRADYAGAIETQIANDNTGANSHAVLYINTPDGGGDPFLSFSTEGGATYTIGVDNSDSDAFKITDGSNPSSGNTRLKISSSNVVTIYSDLVIDEVNDVRIISGSGTPEGVVSAGGGSTYHRTDGAPWFYVKESSSGNTGWTAK